MQLLAGKRIGHDEDRHNEDAKKSVIMWQFVHADKNAPGPGWSAMPSTATRALHLGLLLMLLSGAC